MTAWLLGTGGWMPTERRETACTIVRHEHDGHALILDAGSGLRRLTSGSHRALLDGATRIDIVLTHFHLDHICGLGYVPALPVIPTIWAPGRWLYDRPSAEILQPLRETPLNPFDPAKLGAIEELEPGAQRIGERTVTAREQPRHWDPTAGLRVDDELALITDTEYDPESGAFAQGVAHLLHEAWPGSGEGDATGEDAGRVAREANVEQLTLIHLSPRTEDDHAAVLHEARAHAPRAELGEDGRVLACTASPDSR